MIYIGVTGHRFLAEKDKLINSIDSALKTIKITYRNQNFTIISPLAEGADRLVAVEALKILKARLFVPLPMPESDYLKDFKTNESKEEFLILLKKAYKKNILPKTTTREDSYDQVGNYILDNCDILLAIWDGKKEQGIGGTASIVKKTRLLLKPVIIIYAGNHISGTEEPISLGKKQGKIKYERFPEPSIKGIK